MAGRRWIGGHRCRLRRRNAFDQWLRTAGFRFDFCGLGGRFFHRAIDHLIAGRREIEFFRIAAQALHFVVRCLQMDIWNQQYIDLEAHLDFVNVLALFV